MKIKKYFSLLLSFLLTTSLLIGCNGSSTNKNADNTDNKPTVTKTTNKDSSPDEKKEEKTVEEASTQENTKTEVTENVANKNAEIHFINTGNSDAILIKQDGSAMLIDGGDNDDEDKIVSYLKDLGVTKLNYMIATHPHADHIGGLDTVINSINVENLLVANGSADTKTYTDFINAAANKKLNPSVPLEGAEFKLENSSFKVFNSNGGSNTNEASLVVLYTNGKDKFLFTGDAEQETENEILNKMEDVDVLKVGHHGSKTSTTTSFLDKVKPEYAVITCGLNNKYGHPHKVTIDKLKERNIKIHRTDECGNVVFKSTGSGISTECKDGSFNSPVQEKAKPSNNNSYNNTNNANNNQASNSKPQTPPPTTKPQSQNGKVYWTPNGKSYHTSRGCRTLSRSKIINEGTQPESGKSDPCDVCH